MYQLGSAEPLDTGRLVGLVTQRALPADEELRARLGHLVLMGMPSAKLDKAKAASDVAGLARIDTGARKKDPISFTFCVDSVTHGSLSYDPGANVETCDTFLSEFGNEWLRCSGRIRR